jgi:hypothetical protein
MNKAIENFIEGELYAYHGNLKEIELRREEIMEEVVADYEWTKAITLPIRPL